VLAAIPFAGRTDLEIALELLTTSGVADGERHLPALVEALAAALASRTATLPVRGTVLPGARAALERLHGLPGTVQSVLTGNVAANAAVKLAAFGLERYVDLEVGGYGSDHRNRPELVGVARARAGAKYGGTFPPEDTVLIGDSPLDVAAARASGAGCVAVATGWATAEELAAAGADTVVDDLTETEAIIRAILGIAPEQRV